MARKGQIAVQDNLENNEEFEEYLQEHFDKVICMEVFSSFCGNCVAMLSAVRKVKLELAGEDMVFAKAQADDIDALDRFRDKSEPVYLFITEAQTTDIIFGANGVKLFDVAQRELEAHRGEREGTRKPRPRQPISEPLEDELEKIETEAVLEEERREAEQREKETVQAARKKRVNERLSQNLDVRHMNFIMFWPQHHQAHYDLYERWDRHMTTVQFLCLDVQVAAKETIQLTEDDAREVLYMSDVDLNEACLYALLDGPVLAVMLKMFDTDTRDFVQLLRFALYEDIPPLKEDVPDEEQPPQIPAFDHYATISKSKPEIRRARYEAKMQKKREEAEERERLKSEQERLAREAEEERLRLEKQKEDEERIARLQAGGPATEAEEDGAGGEEDAAGEQVESELVQEEEIPTAEQEELQEEAAPEEQVMEEETPEFSSQTSIEGEDYIPPGGLFVPGLYAPPNELSKANGLCVFFPKLVSQVAEMESEFLPPHVLLTFPIEKRKEVMEVAAQFPNEIIHTGVFAGDIPYEAEHVAYTAKHYDRLGFRIPKPNERLALMVSHRRSVPTLTLATLNPAHVSVDTQAGTKECLALFPVGYGDEYFEEPSIVEEEIEEVVEAPPEEPEPEPEPEAPVEEEEVEEEED